MRIALAILVVFIVWLVFMYALEKILKQLAYKQTKRRVKNILFRYANWKIQTSNEGRKILWLDGSLYDL